MKELKQKLNELGKISKNLYMADSGFYVFS